MEWKLEVVAVPVTDVDRAKAFYVEQAGFNADHDVQVNPRLRFVQLTPTATPGRCSSCPRGSRSTPRCRCRTRPLRSGSTTCGWTTG